MVGRYAVWVLGSSTTLCAHSNLWRDLIHHAKETKSFFDAAQDEGMHKIIDTFRRHRKPVFHKNDDIHWHREYKRTRCSESPRWSIWDCTEAATVCSNFELKAFKLIVQFLRPPCLMMISILIYLCVFSPLLPIVDYMLCSSKL